VSNVGLYYLWINNDDVKVADAKHENHT